MVGFSLLRNLMLRPARPLSTHLNPLYSPMPVEVSGPPRNANTKYLGWIPYHSMSQTLQKPTLRKKRVGVSIWKIVFFLISLFLKLVTDILIVTIYF